MAQTLLALYRENQTAFIGGNPNLIKAGEILKPPTAGQAGSVPAPQAATDTRLLTSDWAAYRQQLGMQAATAAPRESGRRAGGAIATAPVESAGTAAGADNR